MGTHYWFLPRVVVPSKPALYGAVDHCQGAQEDKVCNTVDLLRAETNSNSRFPILFLSLDADPVTPLSSAVKMSRGFGNESATLLIQQG